MTKKDRAYPLMDSAADVLKTADGRLLGEITLTAVAADALSGAELRISAETLRAQAHVARQAGHTQLADNLSRAAELTGVPNDELLDMYATLRPGRATFSELLALAEKLRDIYAAPETARLVEEAASVYKTRGLLRRD